MHLIRRLTLPKGLLIGLVVGLILSQPLSGCAPGTESPELNERTSPAEKGSANGAPILNIAHRGASGRAPENTLAAYELALDEGADYIEQDVRLTRDGVPVVLHDKTLDRTARGPEKNCTGPVAEKSLAQIKTCEVGGWFNEEYPEYAREEYEGLKVPTLEEVFRRYQERAGFYLNVKVDVKASPAAGGEIEKPEELKKLLGLMDEHGLREPAESTEFTERRGLGRVIVVSSDPDSLRRLHALAPALPLTRAYPASATSEEIEESLEKTPSNAKYATGINPWKASVSPDLVRYAHGRSLEAYPYVVNEKIRMEELVDAGVDGMFTAFPARLEEISRR